MSINVKFRKQRHMFSCGLACVAMVADKAYDQVVLDYVHYEYDGEIPTMIHENRNVHAFGTGRLDLHNLLDLYGVRSNKTLTKYKGIDSLPELSILVVSKRTRLDCYGIPRIGWHWVVCVKEGSRKFTVYNPSGGKQSLRDCLPITSFMRIHTHEHK